MLNLYKIVSLIKSPLLSKALLSLRFSGYLVETGWIESYIRKVPVNMDGSPLPWITLPCLDFITERLKKDFNIFEFGAGNSTVFFSSYVKKIVSIEHEKEWFERIYRNAPANVCINYCPLIYDGEYCRFALKTDKKFDLIVVDGRDRVNCIKNCLNSLTDDGCVILDDSEREEYQEGIKFLRKNGFKQLDFWGIALGLTYKKCTTIFYREDNCFGI